MVRRIHLASPATPSPTVMPYTQLKLGLLQVVNNCYKATNTTWVQETTVNSRMRIPKPCKKDHLEAASREDVISKQPPTHFDQVVPKDRITGIAGLTHWPPLLSPTQAVPHEQTFINSQVVRQPLESNHRQMSSQLA